MADSNSKEKIPERGYYFSMILYPEDPKHVWLLHYFEHFSNAYKLCYILHDHDTYTKEDEDEDPMHVVGLPKKNHWHVLVRRQNQTTAVAFAKFCGLNHVEVVHDPTDLVHYFLHMTPEAHEAGKYEYSSDCLCGTPYLCSLGLPKNANFVQLDVLKTLVRGGMKFCDVIAFCNENPEYQDTFNQYNYVLKALVDERDRDDDRDFRRSHPQDIRIWQPYDRVYSKLDRQGLIVREEAALGS